MKTTVQNNALPTKLKLSELCVSPENMRKVKSSKESDAKLKASIAAIGVIQNLIVSAKCADGYRVEAGGRRFAQCMDLVNDGVFTLDTEVPVMILEAGQNAKEFSLAENYMRVATHPVDDFEAFTYLNEVDGMSVSDIAKQFNEKPKFIKQRLALGAVAPELRELCRQNKFDLKILEAFTVSDDHKKQIEAYETFKGDYHRFSDNNIRVYLTEKALTNDNKLVKYVSLSAYKKAGGTVMSDLFQNTTYINDRELFDSLLNSKIEDDKTELLKAWSWVEFDDKFQPWKVGEYNEIGKELKKVPKKILTELQTKQARHDELKEGYYNNELSEELETEFEKVESDLEDLDEQIEDYKVHIKDEMQFAGCIVSINESGELIVYDGLVKDCDVGKLNEYRDPDAVKCTDSGDSEDAESELVEPMYNQALMTDLIIYKQSIAKAALIKNSDLGTDLALFSLCYKALTRSWGGNPLNVTFVNTVSETSKNDILGSSAQIELEDNLSKLDRSWIVEGHLESFKNFRALSVKTKRLLTTHCAAMSLERFGNDDDFASYIFSETGVEPSAYLRPTASNFFKRLKEPHFTNVAKEILGEKWLEANKTKKRPFIAEQLERAVAGEAPAGTPLTQEQLNKWMPTDF